MRFNCITIPSLAPTYKVLSSKYKQNRGAVYVQRHKEVLEDRFIVELDFRKLYRKEKFDFEDKINLLGFSLGITAS